MRHERELFQQPVAYRLPRGLSFPTPNCPFGPMRALASAPFRLDFLKAVVGSGLRIDHWQSQRSTRTDRKLPGIALETMVFSLEIE
jgi:hypothetical protein